MGTDAVVRLGRHLQRWFVTRRQLRSSLSSIYLRLIVINTSDTAGKVQHVSIVFQKHTNKVAWWDDNRPRRARCKASWYFLFCKCITALILWPLAKEKPQRQTDVLRFSCFTLFRQEERKRATTVTGETQTRGRFDKYCSTILRYFYCDVHINASMIII